MRRLILAAVFVLPWLLFGCQAKKTTVSLFNPLNARRNNVWIELEINKIFPAGEKDEKNSSLIILAEGKPVSYQTLDSGKVGLVLDFKPKERKTLRIGIVKKNASHFPSKAHAELSVRQGGRFLHGKWRGGRFAEVKRWAVNSRHFIHDALIRYEGPGLESDKIAYRQYLDERNAMDVFGKKTCKIILPQVGRDSSSSYHEMNWWGMDILKVGNTFGAGSFALFPAGSDELKGGSGAVPELISAHNIDSMICTVVEDGPLRAGYQILYKGWKIAGQKIDVLARHTIHAGSNMVRHEIQILDGKKEIGLAFGIMSSKNGHSQIRVQDGFLQTLTIRPSLSGDSLCIVCIVPQKEVARYEANVKGNNLFFAHPSVRKIVFYSGALWQENIKDQPFYPFCKNYVQHRTAALAHPIVVTYSNKKSAK